jgi:hypothetical protein
MITSILILAVTTRIRYGLSTLASTVGRQSWKWQSLMPFRVSGFPALTFFANFKASYLLADIEAGRLSIFLEDRFIRVIFGSLVL